MKKPLKWTLGIGLGALLAIQLVPIDKTNPPATAAMPMPAGEVGQILKDACMDCHSNETVWPWYANVAPAKFLVADHVAEGREELNFSTWGERSPSSQDHKLDEVIEKVEEGEMPEGTYTWMHPEARLSEAQRQALIQWARQERAKLQASGMVTASSDGESGERARGEEHEREERGEEGQR